MLRLSPQRLPQRYAVSGCATADKFKNNRAAKGKSIVCGVWWPALALVGGCGREANAQSVRQ